MTDERNYGFGESYQFSGLTEGMGKNISYHRDIDGKPKEKILARRGKDDRPQDYLSREKVRKLTDRKRIQKSLGSRLN